MQIKKAKINKKRWYKSQKLGQLGIPNIKLYYIANQMTYIPDILSLPNNLTWTKLELQEVGRYTKTIIQQNNKHFF